MQMRDQYKEWYKFEPQLLKAIETLNIMYYKLAKDHFVKKEDLEKKVDDFLKDDKKNNVDEFINS